MTVFSKRSIISREFTGHVYTPDGKYTFELSRNRIKLYEIDPQGRVRLLSDEEVNRIFGGKVKVLISSYLNGAEFMNNGEIQKIPELNPHRVVSTCMFGEYTLVVSYTKLFLFKGTAMILTKNTREIEDTLFPRVERWEVSHVSHQFRIVSRETGVTLWTYKTWDYTPEIKSIMEDVFFKHRVPGDCLREVEEMLAS